MVVRAVTATRSRLNYRLHFQSVKVLSDRLDKGCGVDSVNVKNNVNNVSYFDGTSLEDLPWKFRVLARAHFDFAQRVTLGTNNILTP